MILTEADRGFIEQQRTGHLATLDHDGNPHVIPICFALRGEHLYFVVDDKPKRARKGLKRLRNIEGDPRVAVVIDRYDENWSRLAYVQLRGSALIVHDPSEYSQVLDELKQRYPQYRAMSFSMTTHPMVRITPLHVHSWRATPTRP